tara:strand:+ start:72 stop:293 length:222 start_codon:yes stop_codon:yes gene_type:complete
MIFKQYEKDGSCDWEFSDKEIEIINKNKKLYLTPESLEKLGNDLMNIVVNWKLKKQQEAKEAESSQKNIPPKG